MQLSDISILSKFPKLEALSLNNNKIKDISIFKSIKNIKELNLAENQITDINQIENLSYCQKLEKLVLKGNLIINNPNYTKKIYEILPRLTMLDGKNLQLLKKENNNLVLKKNESQKQDSTKTQIFKNKSPGIKIKNEIKGNLTSPEPEPINKNQEVENKKEKGKENMNNNNCGIDELEIRNPKISAKTLEKFNKSFKKKKAEGKFFKIKKNDPNKNGNQLKYKINININDNIENNISLKTSRIEKDEQFKTLLTSLSVRLFSFDISQNIKKNWYKRKIIGSYKNGASKLNQSTCFKYQKFDNKEEEKKRKEDSKEKIFKKSIS